MEFLCKEWLQGKPAWEGNMWVEIWIKCYFAKRKKKKCSLYHEGLWAQCGPLILWIHSAHKDEMIFIEALPCRHVVLAWWVMWNFSCCKMLHCQTFKMKWVCLLLNSNASSFHFHPPARTSCTFCAQRLIAVHQNLYSPLPGPQLSSISHPHCSWGCVLEWELSNMSKLLCLPAGPGTHSLLPWATSSVG